MRAIIALFLIAALMGCAPPPQAVDSPTTKPLVVFLVRHAEKVDSSADPDLSVAGHRRAAMLAAMLRSARIEYVHSSDFIRTKNTAAPTAAEFQLDVQFYDPGDLPGLAGQLHQTGGRHLVVGHSNTTPALAGLLGGDPGPQIDESREYDRLYIVTISKDGTTSSVLLRYGEPFVPDGD